MMKEVVLVDREDREIGREEKIKAHKEGKLHRAFSILIFNSKGELLIQQRNPEKYHCGGIWANTCCSHPNPGEDLEAAAYRRLKEECGFDTDLTEKFSFIYRAEFDNGLVEHELDHVFVGLYEGETKPNPEEVSRMKWIKPTELKKLIENKPDDFAPWLKIIIEVLDKFGNFEN